MMRLNRRAVSKVLRVQSSHGEAHSSSSSLIGFWDKESLFHNVDD